MIIEKRSYLYNIQPIGLNTAQIESLSSYISRLAQLHCVTPGILINKVIAPLLKKNYLSNIAIRGGDGFYKSSNAINGVGKIAQDFEEVMTFLTNRNDLKTTTLLNLHDLIPTRGLLKEKKTWCPVCFEDFRENGIVYEKLVWTLFSVTVCTEHKIDLVDLCPECNSRMNLLSRKSVPGYCSKCYCWLGKKIDNTYDNRGTNIDKAIFINELIEWNTKNKSAIYTRDSIKEAIQCIVNYFFNNDISQAAIYLDLSYTTLRYWYLGINRPPIQQIVNICLKLEIKFQDLFDLDKSNASLLQVEEPSKLINIRKRYDHKEIKNILDVVISNKIHISIKKLSNIVGCDRKLITRTFPKESAEIIKNNKIDMLLRKDKRLKNTINKIEEAFISLIQVEEFPSFRKMEGLIGKSIFREQIYRDKFKQLQKMIDL